MRVAPEDASECAVERERKRQQNHDDDEECDDDDRGNPGKEKKDRGTASKLWL